MSSIPSRTARLSIVGSLVALLLILMSGGMHAQVQWHASVGAQSKDQGRQVLAFLPNELWIHAGDTVVWRFGADEIHTVTFMLNGPPRLPFQVGCPGYSTSPAIVDGTGCVSTPPLVKGQTFATNFPKIGNFKVVCLVHQNMTGSCPRSWSYLCWAGLLRRRAATQVRDAHGPTGPADHVITTSPGPAESCCAGGGGCGATAALSLMRFSHDNVTSLSDTVEWTNTDQAHAHHRSASA